MVDGYANADVLSYSGLHCPLSEASALQLADCPMLSHCWWLSHLCRQDISKHMLVYRIQMSACMSTSLLRAMANVQ